MINTWKLGFVNNYTSSFTSSDEVVIHRILAEQLKQLPLMKHDTNVCNIFYLTSRISKLLQLHMYLRQHIEASREDFEISN